MYCGTSRHFVFWYCCKDFGHRVRKDDLSPTIKCYCLGYGRLQMVRITWKRSYAMKRERRRWANSTSLVLLEQLVGLPSFRGYRCYLTPPQLPSVVSLTFLTSTLIHLSPITLIIHLMTWNKTKRGLIWDLEVILKCCQSRWLPQAKTLFLTSWASVFYLEWCHLLVRALQNLRRFTNWAWLLIQIQCSSLSSNPTGAIIFGRAKKSSS